MLTALGKSVCASQKNLLHRSSSFAITQNQVWGFRPFLMFCFMSISFDVKSPWTLSTRSRPCPESEHFYWGRTAEICVEPRPITFSQIVWQLKAAFHPAKEQALTLWYIITFRLRHLIMQHRVKSNHKFQSNASKYPSNVGQSNNVGRLKAQPMSAVTQIEPGSAPNISLEWRKQKKPLNDDVTPAQILFERKSWVIYLWIRLWTLSLAAFKLKLKQTRTPSSRKELDRGPRKMGLFEEFLSFCIQRSETYAERQN